MTPEQIQDEQKFLSFLDEVFACLPSEQVDFIVLRTHSRPDWRKRALSIVQRTKDVAATSVPLDALSLLESVSMPESIGMYEIDGILGSGAMGIVYLGVHKGDGFNQKAAIKLVPDIAESPRRLDRFKVERSVLSKLRHPNIAHMYDGGETNSGAPFLAMEYVDGAPLDTYLQNQKASWDQRLKLFNDICSAIRYAHRNLVVHRDLSPKNIMVNTDGIVKVIDFGIAQMVGDAAHPDAHRYVYRNAGYSAPEDSSDTTADIFSLGAILRLMRDQQDIPRATDLDAIVAKAMDREPGDRYETVEALAEDIDAYRTGHPVEVVSGGLLYKLKRFVQRKPATTTASGAAFFATIGAALIMSFLFIRALEAERAMQARYEDVRELSSYLIFDVNDELLQISGSTRLREKIVDRAVGYYDEMRLDDRDSNELILEAARGYARLGDILGNAGGSNLGDREKATEYLNAANVLVQALLEEQPGNEDVISTALEVDVIRGEFLRWSRNELGAAAAVFQNAEALFQMLEDPTFDDRYFAARGKWGLARANQPSGDLDLAISAGREAIDRFDALLEERPGHRRATLGLIRAYNITFKTQAWKAYFAHIDGEIDLEELSEKYSTYNENESKTAERIAREYIAAGNDGFETRMTLSLVLMNRANSICYALGLKQEGIQSLSDANNITLELVEEDPENIYLKEMLANSKMQEADCFFQIENFDGAITSAREALALQRELSDLEPDNPANIYRIIQTSSVLRWILDGAGELEAACEVARSNLAEWDRYSEFSAEPINDRNLALKNDEHLILERCEQNSSL